MAEKGFDFGALKALKLPQYEKEYCKATEVKKCGAAIIFLDYKLAGKKTSCVVVPFKKFAEAAQAFKDAKQKKEHLMKKTALAELTIVKGAGGKDEITVDLKKGGISPDALKLKGEDLFVNTIGMALKIVGGAEAEYANEPEEEEEGEETTADSNNKNISKEDTAKKDALKQDRAAKIALMQENVDKMNKAVATTPKEKLEPNIKKYEDALAQLTKAAQADGKIDKDEQAKIDGLKSALEELRNAMDNAGGEVKGKKLTEEQKAKIKDNMTKINARLDAIVKNLGL